MAHTISIRVNDDTMQIIEKLCRELDRTKSYIIKKAINQYIAEYSDYQIALDRLRDKDDEVISPAEMRKRLEL